MKTKLKGKNRVRLFRQVAERLTTEIVEHENVAGVILLGGLVRGFTDRFSDVDITVILNKKDKHLHQQIRDLGSLERKHSGLDIDLETHCLEDFKRRKWDERARWDFSNADIVYDPKGEIKKLFKARLKVPKNFWIRRIVVNGEYMKWYCCPPSDSVGTITQAWVERGDLLAAHDQVNYATGLLIKIVFALNKKFLPPPKWRISYSYNLDWQPKNYRNLLEEAIKTKDLSASELGRRLNIVKKMWREIVPKIERETGLTPATISKYYLEEILQQD